MCDIEQKWFLLSPNYRYIHVNVIKPFNEKVWYLLDIIF